MNFVKISKYFSFMDLNVLGVDEMKISLDRFEKEIDSRLW